MCCDRDVIENAEHLILECEAFNDVRERVFPRLRTRLHNSTEAMKMSVMTSLLGGERVPASGRKIPREVLQTIEYLSSVLPKRSEFVADRKGQTQ